MTPLTPAALAEIEQRARQATGLKWLTADDTKRLDALGADVLALLARLREVEAQLQSFVEFNAPLLRDE